MTHDVDYLPDGHYRSLMNPVILCQRFLKMNVGTLWAPTLSILFAAGLDSSSLPREFWQTGQWDPMIWSYSSMELVNQTTSVTVHGIEPKTM